MSMLVRHLCWVRNIPITNKVKDERIRPSQCTRTKHSLILSYFLLISINIFVYFHDGISMTQGYFWDGPELFDEKTMSDRVILIPLLAGSHHKLFKSGFHFAVRWKLRFLGPIFFPNGPLKFEMAHQNFDFLIFAGKCIWPIFMAHPYSGPEITLMTISQ